MASPSAKILVFVGGQFACIKIVCRANFMFSLNFRTLATGLQEKG